MKRLYEHLISQHLASERQMLFLTGPRQVGKTTTSRKIADLRGHSCYLNWDNVDHQEPIVAGPSGLAEALGLATLREEKPFVDRNCFEPERPMIVPARTFLSQLI